MTHPTSNPVKHGSPDGLVVRGRPPFAMTRRRCCVTRRSAPTPSGCGRSWRPTPTATDRPSRSQLASDVGWRSIRSVDTYLAELQRTGYLTVEHQWRSDRGQSRSLYTLEWEPREPTSPASRVPVDDAISAGHTRRRILHGGSSTQTRRLWTTLFPQ